MMVLSLAVLGKEAPGGKGVVFQVMAYLVVCPSDLPEYAELSNFESGLSFDQHAMIVSLGTAVLADPRSFYELRVLLVVGVRITRALQFGVYTRAPYFLETTNYRHSASILPQPSPTKPSKKHEPDKIKRQRQSALCKPADHWANPKSRSTLELNPS